MIAEHKYYAQWASLRIACTKLNAQYCDKITGIIQNSELYGVMGAMVFLDAALSFHGPDGEYYHLICLYDKDKGIRKFGIEILDENGNSKIEEVKNGLDCN